VRYQPDASWTYRLGFVYDQTPMTHAQRRTPRSIRSAENTRWKQVSSVRSLIELSDKKSYLLFVKS